LESNRTPWGGGGCQIGETSCGKKKFLKQVRNPPPLRWAFKTKKKETEVVALPARKKEPLQRGEKGRKKGQSEKGRAKSFTAEPGNAAEGRGGV